MYLTKKNRTMPWAAAAASLTFGAGACGGGDDGPPTSEDSAGQEDLAGQVAGQVERYTETLCARFNECFPEDVADEFGDVEGCEDAYKAEYASSYFQETLSEAEDPEACAIAFEEAFECYTATVRGLSCEALDDYYYADSEDFECEAEYYALEEFCFEPSDEG